MKCLRCGTTEKIKRPEWKEYELLGIDYKEYKHDLERYYIHKALLAQRRCWNCGVHFARRVSHIRRRGPIKSKRGRNSGKVSQHGKKG